MAWIDIINENDAKGELRDLYGSIAPRSGPVDNILKVHSLNPPSLKAHFDLYRTLMYGRSELTRAQREMIGITVSTANHCHY
ncbi:MAG: carboxymuconolactone decarboxylase family protein [Acidobacteriota bacterium]